MGTRNGLSGPVVPSLVAEERSSVFVSAQILGQHTEDGGVATLDHEQNYGLVTFGGAQVQNESDYCVIINNYWMRFL